MSHTQDCACCSGNTDPEPTGQVTCYCPLDGVIETVGRRYAMQVVAILGAEGPTRFSELDDRLGVTSSSTFSACLADLVAADLIERRSFDEVPPRVEYSLTPAGRELEEHLRPLLQWAADH